MSETVTFDIPYYSQYLDVDDEHWKNRSCSVTCLKMLLDFYDYSDVSIEELVREGLTIRPYDDRVGWHHDVIVFLAHNHGALAYREEFKSNDRAMEESLTERGLTKIRRHLATGRPVIVSAVKRFREVGKYHTVVLTGFEVEDEKYIGFYYHDPEADNRKNGEHQYVSLEDFTTHWRKLAIFVY